MCSNVPGLLFSSICVHILELNQFMSSIKVCPRVDVYSKKEHWHITYLCSTISTIVPTGSGLMFPTEMSMTLNSGVMNIMNSVKPMAIVMMSTTKPMGLNLMSSTTIKMMPGQTSGMIEIMPNAMGIIPNVMGMLSEITSKPTEMITGIKPGTAKPMQTMMEAKPLTAGIMPGSMFVAMVITSTTPKPMVTASMSSMIEKTSAGLKPGMNMEQIFTISLGLTNASVTTSMQLIPRVLNNISYGAY